MATSLIWSGCIDFEEKAGFFPAPDPSAFVTPEVNFISKASVLDLSSRIHVDGTLDWTPPAATWVVLRIGYSLIGTTNHPANPEATGLEVDKLNHAYVKDSKNIWIATKQR